MVIHLRLWTLQNAFPIAFKYGDFDYGADDLREFSLSLGSMTMHSVT